MSREFVRRAVMGDLAKLVALERSVETAPHWSEGVWADTLGGERAVYLVEREGEPVGFVVGHEVVGVVELESIAVSSGARRGGVGKMLMEALRGWAAEVGALAVELEVRAGNGGAISFYEALGFVEEGRRLRYYSDPLEDAVLMRAGV